MNGGTATKRPKISKGSSSKDAYMLVYRHRGEGGFKSAVPSCICTVNTISGAFCTKLVE